MLSRSAQPTCQVCFCFTPLTRSVNCCTEEVLVNIGNILNLEGSVFEKSPSRCVCAALKEVDVDLRRARLKRCHGQGPGLGLAELKVDITERPSFP